MLPGAGVEVGDVVAAVGDHHRPRRVAGRPPVGDEPLRAIAPACRRRGRGRAPGSAASACSARPSRSSSSALALPGVDLAAVLGQLDREAAVDEPAERAAGLELGQLAVIADEHELAADRCDVARRAARAAASGPCPPRRPRARTVRQRRVAAQVGEQRGDARARGCPRPVSSSRAARRATATPEHRIARRPATPRARRRARTSCPSRPCRPRPRRRRRPGRAARPSRRCSAESVGRARPPLAPARSPADAGAGAVRAGDLADEPLLEREQLRRRVDAARSRSIGSSRPSRAPDTPRPRPRAAAAARPRCGEARNRSAAASIARASTCAPAGSALAQRLDDVAARERRRALASARSAPPSSAKIRCHSASSSAGTWTRPSSRSSSLVRRGRARPRAPATPRRARRSSSVAASCAAGSPAPRPRPRAGPTSRAASSAASISARRRLNARSTGSGTPAISAIPLRTGIHSTPSSRVSSRAQHRLVDEARRPRVRVEPPAVERRPAPVRAAAEVRDEDVACAAADRRRATCDAGTPPRPTRPPASTSAPPWPRRTAAAALEVAERLDDGPVVRRADRRAQLAVADPEQHAHALRRRERQIEPGDPDRARRAPQRRPVQRIQAGEHATQRVAVDRPASPSRRAAEPDPRRRAPPRRRRSSPRRRRRCSRPRRRAPRACSR